MSLSFLYESPPAQSFHLQRLPFPLATRPFIICVLTPQGGGRKQGSSQGAISVRRERFGHAKHSKAPQRTPPQMKCWMLEGHKSQAKSPEQTPMDQVQLQHNSGADALSSHTNTHSDELHAGLTATNWILGFGFNECTRFKLKLECCRPTNWAGDHIDRDPGSVAL